MTNYNKAMTAANIRYLLALHELDRDGAGARSSILANRLGVTKPSVHTMLRTLNERGLVTREKYEAAHLTAMGKQFAVMYAECFALLYERMRTALGLPPEDCQNVVCTILAQMKTSGLEELRSRLSSEQAPAELGIALD